MNNDVIHLKVFSTDFSQALNSVNGYIYSDNISALRYISHMEAEFIVKKGIILTYKEVSYIINKANIYLRALLTDLCKGRVSPINMPKKHKQQPYFYLIYINRYLSHINDARLYCKISQKLKKDIINSIQDSLAQNALINMLSND